MCSDITLQFDLYFPDYQGCQVPFHVYWWVFFSEDITDKESGFLVQQLFIPQIRGNFPGCCVSYQRESAQPGNLLRLHFKELDYRAFKFLKKLRISDSLSDNLNYQIPPFPPFLCKKRKVYCWGTHPRTLDHCWLIRYSSQQLGSDIRGHLPCLKILIPSLH